MATTSPAVNLAALVSQKDSRKGVSARVDRISDHFTSSGAITINSVLVMAKVGIDDRLGDVLLSSTDHGTVGVAAVKFFPALPTKASDGSDLVYTDALTNALGSSLDINTAAFDHKNIRFAPTGSLAITTHNDPVWKLAGLSSRPTTYTEIFIGIHITTATDAAGSFLLEIERKLT